MRLYWYSMAENQENIQENIKLDEGYLLVP